MDLSLLQPIPEVDMEMVSDVDIEFEKTKAETCPYWPSKEVFLNSFNLEHLAGEELKRVRSLLLCFRHTFYNSDFPEQFKKGVQHIQPIKIPRRPGLMPKKERLRQISPKKLAYLEKHIDKLTRRCVKRTTKCGVVSCESSACSH